MPVRGVNPSYFAGMPTYALDPNAHKPNPAYAQMLTQAMQNNAAMAQKRGEFDQESRFKAVEQKQKAEEILRTDAVNKRLAGAKEAEQARLSANDEQTRDHLRSIETERLIDGLRRAQLDHDQRAAEFFAEELKRRGYKDKSSPAARYTPPEDRGKEPAKPQPPTAAKPQPPTAAKPQPPTARFPDPAEASAAPPMKAAPAGTPSTARFADAGNAPAASAQKSPPPGPAPAPPRDTSSYGESWDQLLRDTGGDTSGAAVSPARSRMPDITASGEVSGQAVSGPVAGQRSIAQALGAPPERPAPPPPPRPDTSAYGAPWGQLENDLQWHLPTEKELLDKAIADVVTREAAGLPPTARPLLPGKSIRRQLVESDLDPNDALLKPGAQ